MVGIYLLTLKTFKNVLIVHCFFFFFLSNTEHIRCKYVCIEEERDLNRAENRTFLLIDIHFTN